MYRRAKEWKVLTLILTTVLGPTLLTAIILPMVKYSIIVAPLKLIDFNTAVKIGVALSPIAIFAGMMVHILILVNPPLSGPEFKSELFFERIAKIVFITGMIISAIVSVKIKLMISVVISLLGYLAAAYLPQRFSWGKWLDEKIVNWAMR